MITTKPESHDSHGNSNRGQINRREFLKTSAAATGGLIIGFNFVAGNKIASAQDAPKLTMAGA